MSHTTGYVILRAELEEGKAKELLKYNIKYDAQGLFKLFAGREKAIESGFKLNEQRYEVYQYEQKGDELQLQGRLKSMESGFAVIKIGAFIAVTYYDYPLLAPEAIEAVRAKLLEIMQQEGAK